MADIEMVTDDHRGIYCPQFFAEQFLTDLRKWECVSVENRDTLLRGPDHEWYWEAWNDVECNATHRKTGATIYQDGAIWLIYPGAIADPDEIDEIVDNAETRFRELARPYLNDAIANLFDGPSGSQFAFDESLNRIRDALDMVEQETVFAPYVYSDCGGWAETDVDLQKRFAAGDRQLRELFSYL